MRGKWAERGLIGPGSWIELGLFWTGLGKKGKGVMGRTGLCWVFLGLGLVSFLILISKSNNLFEFKNKFEFKPHSLN